MKKLLILSCVAVAAVSSMANAASVCSGPTAAGNGSSIAAGTDFVKVDFTPKCSANVLLNYSQNATAFGVVAGSIKGKNAFTGSTGGGGVKASTTITCPSTGCTTTQISDGNADSARDAS